MTSAAPGDSDLADPAFFEGVDALLAVAPARDEIRAEIKAPAPDAGAAVSTPLALPVTPANIAEPRLADGHVMLQAALGLTAARAFLVLPTPRASPNFGPTGLRRMPFSALGSRTESRRFRPWVSARTASLVSPAVLRLALRGSAELATPLQNLRQGLDG